MRFGEYLRNLRGQRNWLLREVAAKTNMDTALLSKIERGHRNAHKEQVSAFAKAFNIDEKELTKQWIADQIVQMLYEQENPTEILKVAEEKIIYLKTNNKNDN
ncbi:helix-turn-helix domain-containing protein [Salegentibacter sp. BLCTC]|uniref:helix-turn-helix domain-containing protein n=1 Tax=Salegentibacter sp. BLCTC TaxID=2697368 RepID=UPI00187B635A|nr:helix-turn-helix transcriptional regulator [Salegentibacter sp. BLCTC]MBE7641123.1 helix-turn-helix domain-containing protein [Salegentibacter sp. BLCTC]